MRVDIRKSFVKDADKLPGIVQNQLARVIDSLEEVNRISEIPACKKLKGSKNAYSLRLGSYRIGFYYSRSTIDLVRILDRKEIYKYFP